MNTLWDTRFAALHESCLARCLAGDSNWSSWFSADDLAFLAAIGCQPREFFDFIEDAVDFGEPALSTTLLIAAVRRDFFLVMQNGQPSDRRLEPDDLPAREDDSLGGIPWLARILAKARAKLRGELHPDIMYGCGGDRQFLARHGLHPADFLRAVWAAGDDDAKVLAWVRRSAS